MNSISHLDSEVETKNLASHPNNHLAPVITPAVVASTVAQANDVSNADSSVGKLLLGSELKEIISFQALLEADDHRFTAHTGYATCRCPFHPDSNPSFSVRLPEDSHGKCFGCGWYGDIVAYEMEFHRLKYKEAWLRLNDFVRQHPRAGRKAKVTPKPENEQPASLTEKQVVERAKFVDRLATDRWLAERICQQRYEHSGQRWNPDTLQQLACEGSLGWAGDALAFLYPSGTKFRRWPHKELQWEGSTSLWRGERLVDATDVYMAEGETDAISLVDSGIEQTAGHLVVAAPSATTFKKEWGDLFKGKNVTLCFDNDTAGENAVQTASLVLKPYARAVLTLDWKEVA